MLQDPLFLLVILAVMIVLGIMLFGIGTFGKGGEFNKKYANKLMQLRLLLQFIAIILIVGYVWLIRG